MIYIGIDPGVKTGFAIICNDQKEALTVAIHNAFPLIKQLLKRDDKIHVRVEDARKRKWFGDKSKEKQQGAGSLTELSSKKDSKITFEMLHPIKGGTKIDKVLFKKISGITKVTSEHARDAYMLIHNYKK